MRMSWVGNLYYHLMLELSEEEAKHNQTNLGYKSFGWRMDELSHDATGNLDSCLDVGRFQEKPA